MCGIAGFSGSIFNRDQLMQSAELLRHRGPDGHGIFVEGAVGLAHRRLSIIELSDLGAQPYMFKDWVLTFNGELYNFREVRAFLQKAGYSFISDSDTEVLIKAFDRWGPACVDRFIGIFAFAIYNRASCELYLFRDRLGVKPLYYTLTNGLAFASELRGILPFFTGGMDLDLSSVTEYFQLGYIGGSGSIFSAVKKLKPGYYLLYKDGSATQKPYWELQPNNPTAKSDETWMEELHSLMKDSFRLRMVSDVPVGVFLSGGIDSSLVTAILQKTQGNIHTFTIGFNDPRFDESPFARAVATHLGTTHSEMTVSEEDAYPLLTSFYDIYDEPFADSSGIPSALVSRMARDKGIKVVLSADGGDELFAGYTHYRKTARLFNRFQRMPGYVRPVIGSALRKLYDSGLVRGIHAQNIEHRFAALAELLKERSFPEFYVSCLANQTRQELNKLIIAPEQKSFGSVDEESVAFVDQMMRWDIQHYLPDDLLVKMDRATMYNGIEGREPFLDHRLVEFAFNMPHQLKIRNDRSKWIVKEILREYVPELLFERPKKGFSIPIFRWFSSQLDSLFEYYLSPSLIKRAPFLNNIEVQHEYRKYKYYKQRGKEYNIEKMWRILSFMMWFDKFYKAGRIDA